MAEWEEVLSATGQPTGFVTDGTLYRCSVCGPDYETAERRGLHLHFDRKHGPGYLTVKEAQLMGQIKVLNQKLADIRAILDDEKRSER